MMKPYYDDQTNKSMNIVSSKSLPQQNYATNNQLKSKIPNEKMDTVNEVKKLIKGYSKSGTEMGLTSQQFIQLSNDLMSTIKYPKQLSGNQVKAIFNMIDTNSDGTISIQQIYRIVMENKVK